MSANLSANELSADLFYSLVEHVEDYAIFAMDLAGRVVHWNEGAARITGYSADEILGRNLETIFTSDDVEAGVPQQELLAAARAGRAADERWHRRKDGSKFWALGIVVPIRSDSNEIIGYGKFLRDRTDLKQMQETLQVQNAALKRADEEKNRFLATLAHELRNPLAVMANSVHVLRRRGATNEVTREEIERIQRQIRHTRRLIDDLAELARARGDKIHIDLKEFDLRLVAREAVDAVLTDAQSRKHKVNMFLTETPIIISGDPSRIHQVFVNLLTNAIRYTPPGGIIGIGITQEDKEAVVRITDSGIGIPPEKLGSIFELFTQVHEEHSESQAGLGIGLALTRELVALHGGSIQACSEGTGKGSEFIVRLPGPQSEPRTELMANSPVVQRGRDQWQTRGCP
jgi:PAS domain S-box-containing protein